MVESGKLIMETEFGHKIKDKWFLDDDIIFLNHGSFGATPKEVMKAAHNWEDRVEREPVRFFVDEYYDLIRNAASRLAEFVGTTGENIVFVENATSGINTVLRSLMPDISPGEEIIMTSHVYPAVRNTLDYVSSVTKSKIVEAAIPFPFTDRNELINPFISAYNEKTKIAVIDHIAFTTGVILPVKEIIDFFRERNVLTIVDGAHVPGQIDLNLDELNPDWYVGNCHKWMFAPKGCALLWSSPDVQKITKPLSISLNHNQGYNIEFDWTGTRNPSSWLAITAAIDFYNSLGKENIINYIHNLAVSARAMLSTELDIPLPAPDDMFGSMAALQLPGNWKGTREETQNLRKILLTKHRIEIPFIDFDGKIWFRTSSQVYNEMQDYEKLADALNESNVLSILNTLLSVGCKLEA